MDTGMVSGVVGMVVGTVVGTNVETAVRTAVETAAAAIVMVEITRVRVVSTVGHVVVVEAERTLLAAGSVAEGVCRRACCQTSDYMA
jgi:hypothetical protein